MTFKNVISLEQRHLLAGGQLVSVSLSAHLQRIRKPNRIDLFLWAISCNICPRDPFEVSFVSYKFIEFLKLQTNEDLSILS
jgi:hypothetical protein